MSYALQHRRSSLHNAPRIGALTAGGNGLVSSIAAAENAGQLNDEDGAAIFKRAKDTRGGQKQYWIELGIGIGSGLLVGYLLGKVI